MHATATLSAVRTIQDPDILRQIHALRKTDNVTNWFYLAREYLFLIFVIGGTILLYESFWQDAWSLAWAAPVTVLAIAGVGAGQHRLATLTHEAAHYMLFKNRLLNEFVSEWFCMFPILGTTHSYRVQHIAHHQYPNDPELDPDWAQLRLSGHRFQFPMTTGQFLWHCFFKQLLWSPNLLRYVLVRATFRVNLDAGPYHMKNLSARSLRLLGLAYHLALSAALVYGVLNAATGFLLWVPGLLWIALLVSLALAPARWFPEYSVKADLSERWRSGLRWTFNTCVLCSIAWLTDATGKPWWLYYFLLWLVPLGTSFAFFMILRQLVQHGNADQARFTNTRIFLVNTLIRMAVFPIGNDYHLPHHLFMMVPHYNLARLHDLLMQTEPYRRQATIVAGYFFHDARAPQHPTVLDLMTHAQP